MSNWVKEEIKDFIFCGKAYFEIRKDNSSYEYIVSKLPRKNTWLVKVKSENPVETNKYEGIGLIEGKELKYSEWQQMATNYQRDCVELLLFVLKNSYTLPKGIKVFSNGTCPMCNSVVANEYGICPECREKLDEHRIVYFRNKKQITAKEVDTIMGEGYSMAIDSAMKQECNLRGNFKAEFQGGILAEYEAVRTWWR